MDDELDEEMLLAACEEWESEGMDGTSSANWPATSISSAHDAGPPHGTPLEKLPGFDVSTGHIYIYPTNYPVRDYQFNIIRQALFKNTLVTLPTGLGKTFIAAVVMFNFYRWYPQGKIIFMAPTKPLVFQQIEACFNIMGIPQCDMAEMTGNMPPVERKKSWQKQRVFFLTPQVMTNDLSRRACPAGDVKCVVVDEAHKALGNHAYCQVVRELSKYTSQFRIVALSATPGSDVKAINQVLTNLLISHIEIRSEESIDIRQYVHERRVEKIVVPLGDELKLVKKQYMQILSVFVQRLVRFNVLFCRDPASLTKFQILKARDAFRQDPPPEITGTRRGPIEGDFAICMSLYHGLELLLQHGQRSLYSFLLSIANGSKGISRTRSELLRNVDFTTLMESLREKFSSTLHNSSHNTSHNASNLFSSTSTSDGHSHSHIEESSLGLSRKDKKSDREEDYATSHPKMTKLQEVVLDHFKKFCAEPCASKTAGTNTRVMIFAQYRDCVQEITDMLNHHWPMIRCMSFIGQASAGKNTKGFTQKEQIRVVNEFRSGGYNTLVSTCVGEEGLDIGDVDLIICYDAHKSPIRLVQRMGRTGRKRQGRIVMLVTEGKEVAIYDRSQYSKKGIHTALQGNSKSLHLYPCSPRMIPQGLNPAPHKMNIVVEQYLRQSKSKQPAAAKASSRQKSSPDITKYLKGVKQDPGEDVFLSSEELAYWNLNFKLDSLEQLQSPKQSHFLSFKKPGGIESSTPSINHLSLSAFTLWQTNRQPTNLVSHSKRTVNFVRMMEFIEIQGLTEDDDIYGAELRPYLKKDDICGPQKRKGKGGVLQLCFQENQVQARNQCAVVTSNRENIPCSKSVHTNKQGIGSQMKTCTGGDEGDRGSGNEDFPIIDFHEGVAKMQESDANQKDNETTLAKNCEFQIVLDKKNAFKEQGKDALQATKISKKNSMSPVQDQDENTSHRHKKTATLLLVNSDDSDFECNNDNEKTSPDKLLCYNTSYNPSRHKKNKEKNLANAEFSQEEAMDTASDGDLPLQKELKDSCQRKTPKCFFSTSSLNSSLNALDLFPSSSQLLRNPDTLPVKGLHKEFSRKPFQPIRGDQQEEEEEMVPPPPPSVSGLDLVDEIDLSFHGTQLCRTNDGNHGRSIRQSLDIVNKIGSNMQSVACNDFDVNSMHRTMPSEKKGNQSDGQMSREELFPYEEHQVGGRIEGILGRNTKSICGNPNSSIKGTVKVSAAEKEQNSSICRDDEDERPNITAHLVEAWDNFKGEIFLDDSNVAEVADPMCRLDDSPCENSQTMQKAQMDHSTKQFENETINDDPKFDLDFDLGDFFDFNDEAFSGINILPPSPNVRLRNSHKFMVLSQASQRAQTVTNLQTVESHSNLPKIADDIHRTHSTNDVFKGDTFPIKQPFKENESSRINPKTLVHAPELVGRRDHHKHTPSPKGWSPSVKKPCHGVHDESVRISAKDDIFPPVSTPLISEHVHVVPRCHEGVAPYINGAGQQAELQITTISHRETISNWASRLSRVSTKRKGSLEVRQINMSDDDDEPVGCVNKATKRNNLPLLNEGQTGGAVSFFCVKRHKALIPGQQDEGRSTEQSSVNHVQSQGKYDDDNDGATPQITADSQKAVRMERQIPCLTSGKQKDTASDESSEDDIGRGLRTKKKKPKVLSSPKMHHMGLLPTRCQRDNSLATTEKSSKDMSSESEVEEMSFISRPKGRKARRLHDISSIILQDDENDDFEVSTTHKQSPALNSGRGTPYKPPDASLRQRFQMKTATHESPKKKNSRPCKRVAGFLDDEAEVSDDADCSSDEDEGNHLDDSLDGFIDNASQLSQQTCSQDMHAVYMKSVRSPMGVSCRSRFKMVHYDDDQDIFSQIPHQDTSYLVDSFVVPEDDVGNDCRSRVIPEDEDMEITIDLANSNEERKGRGGMQLRRRCAESKAARILRAGRAAVFKSDSSSGSEIEVIDPIDGDNDFKNMRRMRKGSMKRSNAYTASPYTKTASPQNSAYSEERKTTKTAFSQEKPPVWLKKPSGGIPAHKERKSDFTDTSTNHSNGKNRVKAHFFVMNSRMDIGNRVSEMSSESKGNIFVAPKSPPQNKGVVDGWTASQQQQKSEGLLMMQKRKAPGANQSSSHADNKTSPALPLITQNPCLQSAMNANRMGVLDQTVDSACEHFSHQDYGEMSDVTKKLQSEASTDDVPLPVILVDSRELASAPHIVSSLTITHGLDPVVCQLQGCDYITSTRMGVEKRTLNEIANGANWQKLLDRVRHMCELFDRPCLIIERDRTKAQDKKQPITLQRTRHFDTTLAALSKTHVKILFTDSTEETAQVLADLVQVEMQKGAAILPTPEMDSIAEQVLKFYQTIPGVSYVAAVSLMHHCLSIEQLGSAHKSLLQTMVSSSRVRQILNYLTHCFDEQMTGSI
ncbi:Fanconi anemia group M protein homolog isoform X2 [Diadema setosum]|uniref:Fanconi anemia group M protein homolog isoform X2 n=1 Tax=Diadema setosum TaxID=31175 RepID=UPI003B3AB4E9